MRKILTTWAIPLVACALWIFLGKLMGDGALKHDFLNLYTGGKLALEGRFSDMHRPEVQLDRERQIVPDVPQLVPFVRPHVYSLVLAPMAALEYRTAFTVWLIVQSVLLLGCWLWAYKLFGADALTIASLFLPPALGIASGQDCVHVLLVSLGAYTLARKDKPLASGAVLALGLVKFHLFLLWPIAMLLGRRWKMLQGFAASGASLAAISLILGGTQGAANYFALLRNKDLDRLSPTPEFMANLQGVAANLLGGSEIALLILVAGVLGAYLWFVRGAELWQWWALTAIAGLLVVPHVYGYDASLLLVAILLCMFECKDKSTRIAATFLSTPIPWLMTLADKPWSAASSVLMVALFVLLVRPRAKLAMPAPQPVAQSPLA